MKKMKPAVDKRVLLFLAGFMWIGVGTMLLILSWGWLRALGGAHAMGYAGAGVVAALIIHHFGFLRVVDKNLRRILPMEGRPCLFSFISWKSYLMIGVMAAMGFLLRHSAIPKEYLSVLYIGIGLGLILSSVRYMRVLLVQVSRARPRIGP